MPWHGAMVVVISVGAIASHSHFGAGMRGRPDESVSRPRGESGNDNDG